MIKVKKIEIAEIIITQLSATVQHNVSTVSGAHNYHSEQRVWFQLPPHMCDECSESHDCQEVRWIAQ